MDPTTPTPGSILDPQYIARAAIVVDVPPALQLGSS
jgi:hypothetical protein